MNLPIRDYTKARSAGRAHTSYLAQRTRFLQAVRLLEARLIAFDSAQKKAPTDWGFVGSMANAAEQIENLAESFTSTNF
jgi:hypothetical protein